MVELSNGKLLEIDSLLNAAIRGTDIERGWEGFLEIFEEFYSEDVRFETDNLSGPLLGKDELRTHLSNLLIPLHVIAEVSGIRIAAEYQHVASDIPDEVHTSWTFRFTAKSGSDHTVLWSCSRRWRDSHVIAERWSDKQVCGNPMALNFGADDVEDSRVS